jgi:hypothetical protein
MSITRIDTIAAQSGTFIVNNTDEKTVNSQAIIVLEDTVFSSIKVGGSDVKSSYIAATATAVKAGAIIRGIQGAVFSGVQLTSGSVALVLV